MDIPVTDFNTNWPELDAGEIELNLREMAALLPAGAATGFVDVHQWVPLATRPGLTAAGGHPDAQQRIVSLGVAVEPLLLLLEPAGLNGPVHSVRELRSRLRQQGIPVQAVGDVVLGARIMLAVHPCLNLADWASAVEQVTQWAAPGIAAATVSAAAPRSDAVVAAVFRVSREEAQTAINYGFVWRNFQRVEKRAAPLSVGDQLIFRTKGRAVLTGMEENTRSRRTRVQFIFYPC